MKKRVLILSFIAAAALTSSAAAYANVEYLCADWGPAMKLPSKLGDKPQISDTDEEIYFLKQVTAGKNVSIYLCKMKPDGTGKTEIKQLWRNPNYPIDTQGGEGTWMDVNARTHKIVLSILFAGSDVTGLWTMSLDGSEFKQIFKPEWGEHLVGVDHASWTPDGQSIVFEERMRGMHPERFNIAICDSDGKKVKRLFEATDTIEYRQPSVSPDDKQIAFSRYPNGYPGGRHIWLANIDGSDARPLPNPDDKRNTHGGDYPAWSPDGKKIYAVGAGVIEVSTGNTLLRKSPRSINADGKTIEQYSSVVMPHWGKRGLLCSGWGGGITVVDDGFNIQQILASSGEVALK